MSDITGIARLYYLYRDHLSKPSVKRRIASLQMTGKIEDYLTKEFVSFILYASKNKRFAIVNSGLKGEPKIDLAIIKKNRNGGTAKSFTAKAFVEAKYFQNRHRLSSKDMDAIDQHGTSLKELKNQLSFVPNETHGHHDVAPSSKSTKVYGLVFVSYTRTSDEEDRKKAYYARFQKQAMEHGFSYNDTKNQRLDLAYEDFRVDVCGTCWEVTLRIGLWRLRPD
ncbi:MAG: hypothetical protein ABI365_08110 [Lysobacteraceae bacterium]